MTVYHGGILEIRNPDVTHPRSIWTLEKVSM